MHTGLSAKNKYSLHMSFHEKQNYGAMFVVAIMALMIEVSQIQ